MTKTALTDESPLAIFAYQLNLALQSQYRYIFYVSEQFQIDRKTEIKCEFGRTLLSDSQYFIDIWLTNGTPDQTNSGVPNSEIFYEIPVPIKSEIKLSSSNSLMHLYWKIIYWSSESTHRKQKRMKKKGFVVVLPRVRNEGAPPIPGTVVISSAIVFFVPSQTITESYAAFASYCVNMIFSAFTSLWIR